MGQIRLQAISGRPEMRGRVLTYRIDQINAHWSQLHIDIPVHYRWAFDYAGLWTDTAKEQFRTTFERNAHQTWSRRFRVVSHSDRRFEVIVNIRERSGSPAEQWEVLVYPENDEGQVVMPVDFPERLEQVRCAYHWRGWTHDIPRPPSPPELRDVAVCFLRASSAVCTPTPNTVDYEQRGGDHEVGHMLGMQHPGGMCSEHACYGRTRDQRGRIMGSGDAVTAEDYAFAIPILNDAFNIPLTRSVWRLEPDPRNPWAVCL